MLKCPPCSCQAIPGEYKSITEALFPQEGGTGGRETVSAFAAALGIEADYRALLVLGELRPVGSSPGPEMRKFLRSFRNNLDLLVRKTWVEKCDEERKDLLLNRIPGLMELIENADYHAALKEFAAVLDELAWLMFGEQSRGDDFIEYVVRIDPPMGLFWWYGGRIGRAASQLKDRALTRELLLVGLCYLTDF